MLKISRVDTSKTALLKKIGQAVMDCKEYEEHWLIINQKSDFFTQHKNIKHLHAIYRSVCC